MEAEETALPTLAREKQDGKHAYSSLPYGGPFLPMAIAYGFARLFLIVESFRLLFFADKEVFVATWASNIPNFS